MPLSQTNLPILVVPIMIIDVRVLFVGEATCHCKLLFALKVSLRLLLLVDFGKFLTGQNWGLLDKFGRRLRIVKTTLRCRLLFNTNYRIYLHSVAVLVEDHQAWSYRRWSLLGLVGSVVGWVHQICLRLSGALIFHFRGFFKHGVDIFSGLSCQPLLNFFFCSLSFHVTNFNNLIL